MFGYIKTYKSELKIKDYELYKGLYCSLCKRLGHDYGFTGRMTLNYDLTFFLLCRMALKEKDVCFSSSHCSFSVRKKCVCCSNDEEDLKYTAALCIIFTYHKIKDDIYDEGLLKKIPKLILLPLIKSKYKKACSFYPSVVQVIKEEMSNQINVEHGNNYDIDLCADASAKALGTAFSYDLEGDLKSKAYYFGYSIGRLVYFLDAADDYDDDKRKGKFNPFVKNEDKYGKRMNENICRILNTTADECAEICEDIKKYRFKNIIDNIIFYGFDKTIKELTKKRGE